MTRDSQTVTIRPACEADIPRLCEMICALAEHHGDAAKIDAEMLRRDVLGTPPWSFVIVATIAGAPVGYAALCPLTSLHNGVRGMNIHHLFVEKLLRGTGVGKALIDASIVKARALNCAYVTVGTDPQNHAAQAIYLAYGFEARPETSPQFKLSLA